MIWLLAAGMAAFLLKSRWNYLGLPEVPSRPAAVRADATVIVPARDEEAVIERCVRSFPGQTVVVVDDASSDHTSERARSAGATILRAPPVAPGILGKPNACAAGARLARTEWILFVDADTWFRPEFLASAVEYASRERLDLLTCFLRQERSSWAERVLMPYSFALYFCGVSARRVNTPHSAEALANGQCMLFRRAAYESIGGHSAVAGSVIEDVALASLAKRCNLRVRVARAERLGAVRMYDSFAAIWRGFAKNSFRFLQRNPWTGVQVIAASILLTSYLPALGLLLHARRWTAGAAFAIVPSALLSGWYGGFAAALSTPAAIYLFQLIALDGMRRALLRSGSLWKGRVVR